MARGDLTPRSRARHPAATAPKRTEAELIGLLRSRIEQDSGNGPTAILVPHVKDAAGHSSRRTIDALAFGLWPSRGLVIDAYEIKCSRSDWRRELKDPEKAEAFGQRADRFTLVVADRSIVHDGELPPLWGLMVAEGKRLVQVKEPSFLHAEKVAAASPLPPAFTRSFVAALVRAASRVGPVPQDVVDELRRAAMDSATEEFQRVLDREREETRNLRDVIAAFEQSAGVPLRGWARRADAAQVGAAVRTSLDGGQNLDRLRQQLAQHAERMREHAAHADRTAAELAGETPPERGRRPPRPFGAF